MKKIAASLFSSVLLFLFVGGNSYAANTTSNNATFPNKKVATIAVGVNPSGMVVTPDSRFVYVANNDSVTPAETNGSSISVIDAQTNTVIKTISDKSFNGTYALAISSDGSTVYALNSGVSLTSTAKTISIIDTKTNKVTGTISGFNGPDAIALTPDGKSAYVANYGFYNYETKSVEGTANTVSLVDLEKKVITNTITVGLGPDSLAISKDNLYVANFYDNTISVVNMLTNTVSTVADPNNDINGPYTIVTHPNGLYAYVTNFGNPVKPGGSPRTSISIINLKNNSVEKNIFIGTSAKDAKYPSGMAITSDGKYLFVTHYSNNGTVTVLDTRTNKIVDSIAVGNLPSMVTISPNNLNAYVSNYSDNTVSVLSRQK